jgi:nicotinamidase-related amidase
MTSRKKAAERTTALVIVDMQNYYILKDSSYYRYFNDLQPGCLDYIIDRCIGTVVPNIQALMRHFTSHDLPVIYLRLCGTREDRRDLHPFFRETFEKGARKGYSDLYPLSNSNMADVHDDLRPRTGDFIIDKTTYSPFTATNIDSLLKKMNVNSLVFSGLATSQCVETTARDASDRGYAVIHIEDAQADYDEITHVSSLLSSRGVCGGHVVSTEEYIWSGDKKSPAED